MPVSAARLWAAGGVVSVPALRVARLTACGRPGKRHDPTSRKRRPRGGQERSPQMPTPDQPQQHTVSATELFARYHQVLRGNVRALVNTSDENIEDACMFAWTKFLSCEFEHEEIAYSWLRTVATRQAIKLDRRSRRTSPLETPAGAIDDRRPRGRVAAKPAARRGRRRREGRGPVGPPGAVDRAAGARAEL